MPQHDSDWEKYKPLLWILWVKERWVKERRLLSHIRHTMEAEYGFHAGPLQYRQQFAKWGFLHNIEADVWKSIGRCLGISKSTSIDSEVVINGVQVPKEKLKKKMSAYQFTVPQLARNYHPYIPEKHLISICPATSFMFNEMNFNWPASMPSFRFIDLLAGNEPFTGSTFHDPSVSQSSSAFVQAIIKNLKVLALKGQKSTSLSSAGLSSKMNPIQLASHIAAIIPQRFPGQHLLNSQIVSTGSHDAPQVILRWLLYQLSNGFHGNDKILLGLFDEFGIRELGLRHGTQLLQEVAARVILERFFVAGILNGWDDVVEWALSLGLNPHTRVRRFSGDDAHLALAILINYIDISDAAKHKIFDLLLRKENYSPLGDYCCYDHGTILESLVFGADILYLEAIVNRELDIRGCEYFLQLNFLDLICSIRAPSFMVAQKKFRFLLDLHSRTQVSSENLMDTLQSQTGLEVVAQKGDEDLFRFLSEQGTNLRGQEELGHLLSSLCITYSEVSQYKLRALIEMGASPNFNPTRDSPLFPRPLLHIAMERGDEGAFEVLLEHGADPNLSLIIFEEDKLGVNTLLDFEPSASATLLQLSLAKRRVRIVELLLNKGAKLLGNELLWFTKIYRCNYRLPEETLSLIPLLVSKGADPNAQFLNGDTPLQVAIREKRDKLVEALVDAGAVLDPKATSTSEFDLLDGIKTIRKFAGNTIGMGDCILRLLEISSSDHTVAFALWKRFLSYCHTQLLFHDPNSIAASLFDPPSMELVITHIPAELESLMAKVLMRYLCQSNGAQRTRFANIFNQLIRKMISNRPSHKQRSKLNRNLWHLLRGAIDDCKKRWVEESWSLSLDILLAVLQPSDGFEACHHPACCDPLLYTLEHRRRTDGSSTEIMRKLLEAGFKPTTATGLYCVANGSLRELELLVEHGFNPTRRYPWSDTALQIASARGSLAKIEYLLKFGANVNSRPGYWSNERCSEHGRCTILSVSPCTALQSAVRFGNLECIKLLLDAEADVNAGPARNGGATALQLAAIKGCVGMAQWLITKYDADVNAPPAEKNGRTALQGAAEYGRLDMVHLLLESGCSTIGVGRIWAIHAVALATTNGHHYVASYLRDKIGWCESDEELYKGRIRAEQDVRHYLWYELRLPAWDRVDDGECCDSDNCQCCNHGIWDYTQGDENIILDAEIVSSDGDLGEHGYLGYLGSTEQLRDDGLLLEMEFASDGDNMEGFV